MRSFLVIFSLAISVIKASDIKFGCFESEQSEKTCVAESKEADVSLTETRVTKLVPAYSSVIAPVRGDRLNEIKSAETALTNRFSTINVVPFALSMRLGRDHYMGSILDYSLETLHLCLSYLNQPAQERDSTETKKMFLRAIFDMAYTSHQGLGNMKSSLLHPLCSDALKFLADSLEPYQIDFLLKNAPSVIFNNFEVITSLKDYSFMTEAVSSKFIADFSVSQTVDFLSIPAYLRTAPVDTLMTRLSSVFEPSRHWKLLTENRSISELLSVKEVVENPRYYPFLCGLIGFEQLPRGYIGNPEFIIEKIRKNGVTPSVLASLVAYIQESNDLIFANFMTISMTWAYLHRNLHLEMTTHTAESIAKINEEFNSKTSEAVNNLLYLRDKREDVNSLIEAFKEGKIPVHSLVTDKSKDWLKHLKTLAHTPFNPLIQNVFKSRGSLAIQSPIHPEDEGNVVALPRLAHSNTNGFFMEAQPELVMNPLIWNSMWRNVFFADGESWRGEEEFRDLTDLQETEKKLKLRFEVIYREATGAKGLIDLVQAWQKLCVVFPENFSEGPRLQRFLAGLSLPPPPEGIELTGKQTTERKLFAAIVALALREVHNVDRSAISILKTNLIDSVEVQKVIERVEKNSLTVGEVIWAKTSVESLENICRDVNSLMERKSVPLAPEELFHVIKLAEVSFASLGSTLSDEQVSEIAGHREILKFLVKHSRALTRTQISGLLKSEIGRQFFKMNVPILNGLLDYSQFTLKDFDEFGMDVERIRLALPSLSNQVKLISLTKKGFSSVDNPMSLVTSLGNKFWADVNLFKNLSLWELFNPMVLAMDLNATGDGAFIYHVTGINAKLHERVLLNVALVFLVKWLIAQDWYSFVYHVLKSKSATIGKTFIGRLDEIYRKYLVEGEQAGRGDILRWFEGIQEARGGEDETILASLAELSVSVDAAPLTPFRTFVNKSASLLAKELAKPFIRADYSASTLNHVKEIISTRFKPNDRMVWLARLEILSEFTANGFTNSSEASAMCRCKLRTLPVMDAVIYKWALEAEGVDVERIFRDTSDGPVEINTASKKGLVVSSETVKGKEVVKTSGGKNKKKSRK